MIYLQTLFVAILAGLLIVPFHVFHAPEEQENLRGSLREVLPVRPVRMPEIRDALDGGSGSLPIQSVIRPAGGSESPAPPRVPRLKRKAARPAAAAEVNSPHLRAGDRLRAMGDCRGAILYYQEAFRQDAFRMPAAQKRRVRSQVRACRKSLAASGNKKLQVD